MRGNFFHNSHFIPKRLLFGWSVKTNRMDRICSSRGEVSNDREFSQKTWREGNTSETKAYMGE